jgi:hypothetical protein
MMAILDSGNAYDSCLLVLGLLISYAINSNTSYTAYLQSSFTSNLHTDHALAICTLLNICTQQLTGWQRRSATTTSHPARQLLLLLCIRQLSISHTPEI